MDFLFITKVTRRTFLLFKCDLILYKIINYYLSYFSYIKVHIVVSVYDHNLLREKIILVSKMFIWQLLLVG